MNRLNSVCFGIFLLALQACAPAPPLAERHQASGLNKQFNGDQITFAEYVARSRAMIASTHAAISAAELDKIVAGNAPFELKPPVRCAPGKSKPYRRGILLTHGLTDSPYFMRHLGTFFQENCFRVMAVLLPGHGTQPGDLLEVGWQEWAKAVAFGTDQLAAEVDEIYLGGFSLGGALSVYQSQRDERVRGLFLFTPALKISSLAVFANLHKIYSWALPSGKWLSVKPDKDIYKYESFASNGAAQVYALTQELNSQTQGHQAESIPVFAAASWDDSTVDTPATVAFMARTTHPSSRLVLYSTDTKQAPAGISANKLVLVNSVMPEQKILSSAHTAIVLPPEDTHYGVAGDYANCLHYFPDEMGKYAACSSNKNEVLQGELTKQNLKVGTLRRLMYNPNFAALKISMRQFIASLP